MTVSEAAEAEKDKKHKAKLSKKAVKKISADLAKNGAPNELTGLPLAIWNAVAPGLRSLNFLRDSDQMAFARYCTHAAKWWQLTEIIDREGDTYWTDSNHGKMMRLNPAALLRERIEKHLVGLEDRFGMNPAYRQQILQRMAGLTPTVPGDLFAGQNGQSDDTDQSDTPIETPSAVGILSAGNSTAH